MATKKKKRTKISPLNATELYDYVKTHGNAVVAELPEYRECMGDSMSYILELSDAEINLGQMPRLDTMTWDETVNGTAQKHNAVPVIRFKNCSFTCSVGGKVSVYLNLGDCRVIFDNCTFHWEIDIAIASSLVLANCRYTERVEIEAHRTVSSVLISGLTKSEDCFPCFRIEGVGKVCIKDSTCLPARLYMVKCDNVWFKNVVEKEPGYRICISEMNGYGVSFEECNILTSIEVNTAILTELVVANSKLKEVFVAHSIICSISSEGNSSVTAMPIWLSNVETLPVDERIHVFPTQSNVQVQLGRLVLYKKVYLYSLLRGHWPLRRHYLIHDRELIVQLEVPSTAKRHYERGDNKIRVSEAKVVGMYEIGNDGKTLVPFRQPLFTTARSIYDYKFRYKVGKVVKPRFSYDESDFGCASGIHGFLDPSEAIWYN